MVAILCSILLCVPASRGGRTGRPYGLRSARNMRIQVTPDGLARLSNPPFRGTCTPSSGKTEPPCTSSRPAPREPPRWQPMAHRRPQFRTRASSQDPPMRRGCRDPMEEPWPGTPLHPPPVHPRMGFGAFACRMGSPESSLSFPSRRFLHQAMGLLAPLDGCRWHGLAPATGFGTRWAAG